MLFSASAPGKTHLALISEKAKSVFKADLWEVESWLRLGRLRNSRLPVVLALSWICKDGKTLSKGDIWGQPAVIPVTEARFVNTLTSTSLTSRSKVISALGRYNQKCGVVENEYV